MPLPNQGGGDVAVDVPAARRQRTLPERIGYAEQLSGGTLPSRLILALAQSQQLDDPGLERASTLMARTFDLPPNWFFHGYSQIPSSNKRDGLYVASLEMFHEPGAPHQPLSWETAKRIVKPFEPEIISAMLANRGFEEGSQASKDLAHIVRGMAPLRGDNVPFGQVLAAAMAISYDDTDTKIFNHNLAVAASSPSLPGLAAIAVAHQAARRGLVLNTLSDVGKLIVPEAAQAIDEAAELRRRQEELTPEYLAAHPELAAPQLPGTPGYIAPGQTLKASLGAGVVAALHSSGDLAQMLQETEDNYVKAAKELESQAKIPFQDSMLGHVVGKALNIVNRPVGAVVRLGLTPITSFTDDQPGFDTNAFADAWDILNGRTDEFTELEKAGIPWYATLGVELAVSFGFDIPGTNVHVPSLDPLIALGQFGHRANELRTVFGLAERGRAAEWPELVTKFVRGRVGHIGDMRDVSVAEYLLAEADRSKDAETAFTRAVDNFRSTYGTAGIHPAVSERIYRWARSSRGKIPEELRLRGVEGVLLAGFGAEPEIGSLGEEVQRFIRAQREVTRGAIPESVKQMELFNARRVVRVAQLDRDVESALGVLNDTDLAFINHGGAMFEIPKRASTVVRLEHQLRTSGVADTSVGQWIRHAVSMAPNRVGASLVLDLEDAEGSVRDFERYLIRSRSFSVDEISKGRLEFIEATRPDSPTRELNFVSLMNRYDAETIRRVASSYGVDEEWVQDIVEKVKSKLGARSGDQSQVFGIERTEGPLGPEATEVTDPFLVSQRPNSWTLLDPVLLRRGIAETIGTWRQFRDAMLSGPGKAALFAAPEAKAAKVPLTAFLHDATDLIVRDLFLSWWKPLVVARPAYILRVAGMEEQARFLATMGIARRMESGSKGARILTRLDALRGVDRLEVPVEGLTEPLRFPRPGLLPNEPLANNVSTRLALASEEGWSKRLTESLMPGRWGVVTPKDEHFLDWWHNALVHQFGMDALGRRYLDDISRGISERASVDNAMSWLTAKGGEGPRYIQRLMGQPLAETTLESVRLQVERGVRIARDLTRGNETLASAARDGLLRLDDLRVIPTDQAPAFVAGPLSHEQVLAKTGPLKRAVDGYIRLILEEPTNRLSRQPFFKSWYDRVLKGLVSEANTSGRTITPELMKSFESSARKFGILQVKRVMFDLARQGRVDEMTRNVLVFVQPFLEWPVAWSRIVRQNPAMIGYAVRLGHVAMQSGFVRHDPDTGELVVPLSWWAGAAPLLAAFTGGQLRPTSQGGGWELSAPLTSFNMFAQSTFNIPTGNLAGDLPIPLPNFNPEAMWAVQQLVEHDALVPGDLKASVKARISSWLFAYGEVSPGNPASLMPSYLRHLFEYLAPQWFESEINLQSTNFLQLQEAMGLEPNADHARAQARELSLMRFFFSALFPAAPMVDFPTAPLKDEWNDLLGTSESYQQALAVWGQRHPDLRLIPLARTMWSAENPSPVPIAPNAMVAQLLDTKGAEQFAKDHPRWVWAIIPQELRDGQLDYGNWFAQLASGQREVLSPERFLVERDVQLGWDAYFSEREAWLAWQDSHPNIGPGDPPYEVASNRYNEAIDDLREQNPEWAARAGVIEIRGPDPRVMAEARQLAADKTFTKTVTGKGLAAYITLRDDIEDELAAKNLTSVRTVQAGRLGLTEQYDEGVADIVDEFPDFGTAYRLFFAGDLEHVKTAGDKALDRVPGDVFDEQITPWWGRFEELRDLPNTAGNENERNMAYEQIRAFQNKAYEDFPAGQNPMILRWRTLDPSEKQEYLVSLVGRSYGFYSRFDRSTVLGDKATKASESFWTTYNTARTAISERDDHDPDFTAGDAYKALDRWALGEAAKSKLVAHQIVANNTWGYAFSRVLPQLFPHRQHSDPYWQAVLDAVGEVQQVVTANELHGDAEFDPKRKVLYVGLRDALENYVDGLREENVQFRSQWDFLESASGPDPLLDYFMPSVYFPIGGYPGDRD